MDRFFEEIGRRGMEFTWENGFPGEGWAKARTETVERLETGKGIRLYGADSWKKYSRHVSYPIKLRYLAGVDRGHYWAVRVPSTCSDIEDAIEWLTPAPVKKARAAKRWVARQGDVYFVETRRKGVDINDLPGSHVMFRGRRLAFWHRQHRTVRVPAKVKGIKVYRQKQLTSGQRRAGRTFAD